MMFSTLVNTQTIIYIDFSIFGGRCFQTVCCRIVVYMREKVNINFQIVVLSGLKEEYVLGTGTEEPFSVEI